MSVSNPLGCYTARAARTAVRARSIALIMSDASNNNDHRDEQHKTLLVAHAVVNNDA